MSSRVKIIAEAGVNHNGSLKKAFDLVDAACKANVDYIKFQTFKTEEVISKNAPKADYQKKNNSDKQTQYEMVKNLELSKKSHLQIIKYCQKKKIKYFSTAFDNDSFIFLRNNGLDLCKIPSGEINNLPYIRFLGEQGLPILMSTGMSTIQEIEFALNTLVKAGTKKENITLLHCNTAYPTPFIDANITAIKTLKDIFNVNVGYSDHTLGLETAIAAVALGATFIEKHFTLKKNDQGPDHKASLNVNELTKLVKSIRNVELSLGDGIKTPTNSEKKNILIARRSIVAATRIKKGTIFSSKNIKTKRPGSGLSPTLWDNIIGTKSKFDFEKDDLIKL